MGKKVMHTVVKVVHPITGKEETFSGDVFVDSDKYVVLSKRHAVLIDKTIIQKIIHMDLETYQSRKWQ